MNRLDLLPSSYNSTLQTKRKHILAASIHHFEIINHPVSLEAGPKRKDSLKCDLSLGRGTLERHPKMFNKELWEVRL